MKEIKFGYENIYTLLELALKVYLKKTTLFMNDRIQTLQLFKKKNNTTNTSKKLDFFFAQSLQAWHHCNSWASQLCSHPNALPLLYHPRKSIIKIKNKRKGGGA